MTVAPDLDLAFAFPAYLALSFLSHRESEGDADQ
jgi:hypothetical protein